MGKIVSASTVYATAYLTEKGRTYLFNKNNVRFDSNGNDLFQVLKFTLGDPDTNYKTAQRLASGDVPDITGKSEGCLKSTTDYVQTTLAYFAVDVLSFSDPLYSTNIAGDVLIINTDSVFPVNATTDVPPVSPILPGGYTLGQTTTVAIPIENQIAINQAQQNLGRG